MRYFAKIIISIFNEIFYENLYHFYNIKLSAIYTEIIY